MSTHADDSVSGWVQTNVALERCSLSLALSIGSTVATAARFLSVVTPISCGSSSAGRPPVTRGPGTRSRHNIYCRRTEVDAPQSGLHAPTWASETQPANHRQLIWVGLMLVAGSYSSTWSQEPISCRCTTSGQVPLPRKQTETLVRSEPPRKTKEGEKGELDFYQKRYLQ